MTKAIVECVEYYNKETRTLPLFRLTYNDYVWEFRANSRGEASSEVRWHLDCIVFGKGNPTPANGFDSSVVAKQRIYFEFKD